MSKKSKRNQSASEKKKIKEYNTVDLFAGAGGLSLGFKQIKGNIRFNIRAAFENNPYMQETYRKNHPGTDVYGDVCTADYQEIQRLYGPIDVVIGGPPCQGFSNANRQKYAAINLNNKLVKQYVRAITELRPKAFVMENVSMLKSDVHRFYLEQGDVEAVDRYGIETRDDSLILLDEQFYFEGAEAYIGGLEKIEQYEWPDALQTELRVIYKFSKNSAKLQTTLEKHKSRIYKAITSYSNSAEANSDNPIVCESLRACKCILNYYEQTMDLTKIRESIEPALMIQRMLSRMKEILTNHIVIDEVNTECGLKVSVRTFAVFEYLSKILQSDTYNYALKSDVLCAANYGAPQKRMRFVIIGVQRGISEESDLPAPKVKPEDYSKVEDAIADLEKVSTVDDIAEDHGAVPAVKVRTGPLYKLRDSAVIWNHIVTKTTPTALSRFKAIREGQNFHALSEEMKSNTYTDPARTQNTIYLRLNYQEPCGTVVNVRKSMWIHPRLDRAISIREAARLQTFPDSFRFYGSKDQQYQQVGNAVPPIMAKAIAKQVKELLKKDNDGR
ncbi:MAG: DNA cytosine methyltransferase [Oscillospiraceae bacterium]|nr:DNA cytosine methyltransferase [Oscillospiraceae bacterium]